MLQKFYFAICLVDMVIFVQSQVIYTVSGPGTIRSYFKYNVAVSVHETEGPCEIEVGISSPKYNISKVTTVEPMSTQNVEFDLPHLLHDKYKLTVKGISGITVQNSTSLNFELNDQWAVIQMDKPIYKAGDLIQFRVLFLDERTHPAQLRENFTIGMTIRYGEEVKTWENVTLTQGVFSGEFLLSENPKYGEWFVKVYSQYRAEIASKSFLVALYKLPAFDVIIDTAHDVALTDEVIKVSVKSMYTFGKPVKGKATIFVSDERFNAKKTIAIDGKVHVEFNIQKEVPNTDLSALGLPTKEYIITAMIEEKLTGSTHNSTATVILHKNSVIFVPIILPRIYYLRKPTIYIIAMKKVDGSPIQDKKNPLTLQIGELKFNSTIDNNGLATFNFTLQSNNYTTAVFNYLDNSNITYIAASEIDEGDAPRIVHLKLKTKRPQLRKNVSIEVNWNEPINYFIYIITARGHIIEAKHINVRINAKSYTIEFSPTLEMIPNTAVFVQYIYNNNLRFEEMKIEFERDFQNTLEISAKLEASPGDDIEFNITTDPNSFVGLLGIDQRLLLLGTGNDISRDAIFDKLVEFDTHIPIIGGEGRYPGKISGLVTLTNANYPFKNPYPIFEPTYLVTDPPGSAITVRTRFPETWIFENFEMTNATSFSFTKQIPDTITSWIITGFSMNSKTGLALTNQPTKIQVFRPFFISVDLPYSVKQGEVISITVLIFNYLNEMLETEVSMDNSDKEFEFTQATNEVDEQALDESEQSKQISMASNSGGSVSFLIKPKNIGIIAIKVTAVTAMAGYRVRQQLKVEPEGVTQYQNRAFFINLTEGQELKEEVTIDIPADAIPHSEHLELLAIGDFVGLTLKNIDHLVNREHIIRYSLPSVLVLKYVKTIHQTMPNEAINSVKLIVQSALARRRNDGGFSYPNSNDSEIIFLTAYEARALQHVSDFIKIDQELTTKALDFLASKQMTDGKFAEFGHLVESSYLNEVALTAFVLRAFLENKNNTSKYGATVQRGVQYLIQNLNKTDDIYAQSISAIILKKVKDPSADDQLSKLKALAKHENGHTWWSRKLNKQKRQVSTLVSSTDIEITSYILLAMLEQEGSTEELIPIINWLLMQRNSNGGFASTMATIAGNEALIKFAEKTDIGHSGTMDINFISEGPGVEEKGTVKITPENSLVPMTHELPKTTRKLKLTAKGNGSSLVQLSYKYNTIDKDSNSSLRLSVSVRKNTPPKKLIINICTQPVASVVESERYGTKNIVLEVTLPSGFITSNEELIKLEAFEFIIFVDIRKSGSVAIIYLDGRVKQQKCLSVEATRKYEVARQKRAPIIMYDYDNENRKTTEFYEVQTSLCDIYQGNDCQLDCLKQVENVKSSSTLFDLPQLQEPEGVEQKENAGLPQLSPSEDGLANITDVRGLKATDNGQFPRTKNSEITLDVIYEEVLSLKALNINAIDLLETLQVVKRLLTSIQDALKERANCETEYQD